MKITITGRNIDISENLNQFIQEKINKLSKYDKEIHSMEIVLSKESRAEKIEIIANSKSVSYITKCHSSVFEKTLLRAIENLKAQILKSKKKY